MSATTLDELRALVAERPAATAVFSDFDGTLAPIVARSPDARPLPRAVAALEQLAARCRLAAVVSGRPLAFLGPFLAPPVRLAGLYGLEQRIDGVVTRHPDALRWEPIVAAVATRARAELPADVDVELKTSSLTLHTRNAPHREAEVAAWAEAAAVATGLLARPAKRSVELHPPVAVDKGTTVAAWAAGAEVVVFAGDDAGDLDAFAALRELRRGGARTFALGVGGPEAPPAVLAAADVVLDGPPQLADVLAQLAAAAAS